MKNCLEKNVFKHDVSTIVDRGKWLRSPINIREANKQAKIYVGRSLTLHIFFLCSLALCRSYIIAILLLVSCMRTHNHLLYFTRFCVGSTTKISNKNIQQRPLTDFITIHSVVTVFSACFEGHWVISCSYCHVLPSWNKVIIYLSILTRTYKV